MTVSAFQNINTLHYPAPISSAKELYFALLENPSAVEIKQSSVDFIESNIAANHWQTSAIPEDLNQLEHWLQQHNSAIGKAYQHYLDGRKSGEPRRYFRSKAHALYFIRAVAPTKMVDGSWLYGITKYWQNQRLSSLIKIYLEELGDGHEPMNHVLLYRDLLRTNECEDWKDLPEAFFSQGTIQLALANNAHEYLPEIIGFNLAYEQLPLHLLITAYELKELNLDPYYFTLHITIDNAQSGHAHNAIQAVSNLMPAFGNQHDFYRRVVNGAKLNHVGLSTLDIMDTFDLQDELIHILQKKAALGQHMHSDRCIFKERTINQWLSDVSAIPELLSVMQESGWIHRHSDPENSRFWKIITGDRAPMFGVFTTYERQVLYEWIAGDVLPSLPKQKRLGKSLAMSRSTVPETEQAYPITMRKTQNIVEINPHKSTRTSRTSTMLDKDLDSFEAYANSISDIDKRASLLTEWMSPSRHHTAIGLWATRNFKDLLIQN